MNRITYRVATEVLSHEAIIRQAYKDSENVWTWSGGITSKSGHDVTRYIDNPQPMKRCIEVYVWVLQKYADDVTEVMGDLTEEQFAAALSFHWNTGAIRTASWVKHWKAGDIARARKSIMNWRKPAEIIPRRQKERDLFFNGKWSGDGKVIEYTRLTSRHTPVWGSAKRVDIRSDLLAALNANAEPPVRPDVEPPQEAPEMRKGWLESLIKAIIGVFRK